MKLIFLKFCMAIILAAFATHSIADEFRQEEPLYVIVSSANVHTEPRKNSSIFVTLPIAAEVTFMKFSEDKIWININSAAVSLEMDAQTLWIAADSLSRAPPRLDNLITQYDKTPKENLAERRKWAERAAALDPLNLNAQKRLIDTLTEMSDPAALDAAKKTFEQYHMHQPSLAQGGTQRIFGYNGSLVSIVGGFQSGKSVTLGVEENADFHNRGQFYYLYSRGRPVGYVVTQMRFNCAVHECPQDIPARYISLPNTEPHPKGVATNFPLLEKQASDIRITKEQKTMLWKMAQTWIKSSDLSGKEKKLFLKKISTPSFKPDLDVGQLTQDGKLFLVANWAIGSMDAQHYSDGGDDDFYESLLIIAEQQQDGTFKLAKGSGSLTENGCTYSDRADIDGDGTDELLLKCEQLEGSHDYRLLKRIGDKWKDMFNE